MQVKLKDIAEKSGFSITTVSRALGGYSDVNEDTRRQIVELALSMGYEPNSVARQLRNQRTYTLGMILPANEHSFAEDYFNELMMQVGHFASLRQYDLLISAQNADREMDAYKRIAGGRKVDGMIIARIRQNDPRIQYLKTLDLPFVVTGRSYPGEPSDYSYVDLDSETGIFLLGKHFIELGHTHIGFICSPQELANTPYRLRGYQNALVGANIAFNEEYVVYGNLKHESGYQAAHELLDKHPAITAIMAANDVMALGAIQAIHERGKIVGEDIAVSGFDDIPAAAYSNPPLTTIRQPIQEIGRLLVDLLIQVIADHTLVRSQILLPPELIIRESSVPRVSHLPNEGS